MVSFHRFAALAAGLFIIMGCGKSVMLNVPDWSFSKCDGRVTFSGMHYFSKDRKRLALRHHDGIFRLHDLIARKIIAVIGKSGSRSAVTGDGNYIVTFDEEKTIITISDMHTGRPVKTIGPIDDTYIEMSPGNSAVLISTYGNGKTKIRAWSSDRIDNAKTFEFPGDVYVKGVSIDDRYFFQSESVDSGGKKVRQIKIRNMSNGDVARVMSDVPDIFGHRIMHSPDGKYLLLLNAKECSTVDYQTGEVLGTTTAITGGSDLDISFYGTDTVLVDGSVNTGAGDFPCRSAVFMYNYITGKKSDLVGTSYNNIFMNHTSCHRPAFDISPDGKYYAFGVTRNFESPGVRISYVEVRNAETGQIHNSFRAHRGVLLYVKFLPDGKTLITSANDREVRYWDIDRGHPMR